MMDHVGGTALYQRHLKRFEYQLGTQIGLHRPTHDPAAENVEHHRQIEKARPGRNVGYIGNPQPIGRRCAEVALDQVRRRPRGAIAHRGNDPVAPAHAAQPDRAHQPCNALDAHANALLCKLDLNARRAVGGARATMDLDDPRAQFGVRTSPCRGRAPAPRVIATGGDAQHAAHRGNPVHGLVSPYECERRDGVAPVS